MMGLRKWQDEDIFPGYRSFPGFNSVFTDLGSSIDSVPSVNIREKNNEFILEVAAPGMAKDEFDVSVDNDMLIITGNKEEKKEQRSEDDKYTRREFSYASFKRTFQLPQAIKAESIDASYENGVLCITIPKKDEAAVKESKRIKIK